MRYRGSGRLAQALGLLVRHMAIQNKSTGSGYEAIATPPHVRGQPWTTPNPMKARELVAALRELGCHPTDIGDAFYAANPSWLADVS